MRMVRVYFRSYGQLPTIFLNFYKTIFLKISNLQIQIMNHWKAIWLKNLKLNSRKIATITRAEKKTGNWTDLFYLNDLANDNVLIFYSILYI